MTIAIDGSTPLRSKKKQTRSVILIPLIYKGRALRTLDALEKEVQGLADAIQLDVIFTENFNVSRPNPALLFGKGQIEQVQASIADEKIKLAIVDHTLSPVQQRNLEKHLQCKVIDRTGLILEIFGERARTREGKLQVELAALNYQKSRLVRSWTHLERQRGGFGFMGGPGESQLEIDQRLIIQRISKIKQELLDVRRTRGLQRKHRRRTERPTIALVGYTNAGKSTLFNRLTGAEVMTANLLFATLDPTLRSMALPSGRDIVISDTVGFISDLPTQLVEAFRATLEEVIEADVILHVRDVSHPETKLQRASVLSILAELGIMEDDERLIEVMNKADILPEDERARLVQHAARISQEVDILPAALAGIKAEAQGGLTVVSALTGEGIDGLLSLIEGLLAAQDDYYLIIMPVSDGAALSWLYSHGEVVEQKNTAQTLRLRVKLNQPNYGRFIGKYPDYTIKYSRD